MMAPWPCPIASGGHGEEHAFALDRGRAVRVLVIPALFDEANRLRRFAVETLRALDGRGIDSVLIDLPGCNESPRPLSALALTDWQAAVAAASAHFRATHLLALRGGALAVPPANTLPLMMLAPVNGAAVVRQMLRARVLSSREAGREERSEALLAQARATGITLSGHDLSARMVTGLEAAEAPAGTRAPSQGPGPWLRAEPGEDRVQSEGLAACVATWVAAERAS